MRYFAFILPLIIMPAFAWAQNVAPPDPGLVLQGEVNNLFAARLIMLRAIASTAEAADNLTKDRLQIIGQLQKARDEAAYWKAYAGQ